MIVMLPDSFKDWIELRVKDGEYKDASDYVRDLVRRDCAHLPEPELTIEEVRRIVDEARMGGVSTRRWKTSLLRETASPRSVATSVHKTQSCQIAKRRGVPPPSLQRRADVSSAKMQRANPGADLSDGGHETWPLQERATRTSPLPRHAT